MNNMNRLTNKSKKFYSGREEKGTFDSERQTEIEKERELDKEKRSSTTSMTLRTYREPLRNFRSIKEEYIEKFGVKKKVNPYEAFRFVDEHVEVMKQLQKAKTENSDELSATRKRICFPCVDSHNFGFDCYIIPKQVAKKKSVGIKISKATPKKINKMGSSPKDSSIQSLSTFKINKKSMKTTRVTDVEKKKRGTALTRMSQRPVSFFKKKKRRKSRSESQGSKTAQPKARSMGSGRIFPFKGVRRQSSMKDMTKMFPKQPKKEHQLNSKTLFAEFGVMAVSNHQNLQYIKSTVVHQQTLFVFVESLRGCLSLYTYIKERNSVLKEDIVAFILKQIVSAVLYLHTRNRVIRNLSLANIFIQNKTTVKIANLSQSRQLTKTKPKLNEIVGSPVYMAPEMLTSCYDVSVDIWAVGVIAKELSTGKLEALRLEKNSDISFHARSPLATLLHTATSNDRGTDFPPGSNHSKNCKDFAMKCLRRVDPSSEGTKEVKSPMESIQSYPTEMIDAESLLDENIVQERERLNKSATIQEINLSPVRRPLIIEVDLEEEKYRLTAQQLSKHPFLKGVCKERRFENFVSDYFLRRQYTANLL